VLPFARLNLRWNPFGEVPSRERGRLAVVGFDIERIIAQLSAPGFAIELLGPCGRGKSTHLHALHTRFPKVPVTYVDIGARPRIPRAPVVFVDESQHLSLRARRRLFGRRASFVLATHESHAAELAAAGVHCETFRVGGVDELRVREMVARRLEWARLGPGPLPTVPEAMLQELAREHTDDLRAVGDALYDWVQVLKRRAHGEL
jgi:hypothetical protein